MTKNTETHATNAWPTDYDPSDCPVHAYNEIRTDLSPEQLWPVLTDATAWPDWYNNARKVAIQGKHDRLADRVTFTWITFGLPVISTVQEYTPLRRLGWVGKASLGSIGYHRWDIRPTPEGGSLIVTEEVQKGPMARLLGTMVRRSIERQHQNWLEGLVRVAAQARS